MSQHKEENYNKFLLHNVCVFDNLFQHYQNCASVEKLFDEETGNMKKFSAIFLESGF